MNNITINFIYDWMVQQLRSLNWKHNTFQFARSEINIAWCTSHIHCPMCTHMSLRNNDPMVLIWNEMKQKTSPLSLHLSSVAARFFLRCQFSLFKEECQYQTDLSLFHSHYYLSPFFWAVVFNSTNSYSVTQNRQ